MAVATDFHRTFLIPEHKNTPDCALIERRITLYSIDIKSILHIFVSVNALKS